MRMLSSVSVFVAVILGFLVVYANRFLVRRRKREFGIYLTLGMGRAQVAAIMVMETLAVGVAALVVGLVLGVLLSQVMMYVTANLFEATIPGFAFVFSPGAALSTLACFAAIFALSLLLNVREVSRYRLIDLINADKVSEKVKARSLPVSVVLFLVSLVLMGVAYRTLLENGVMSDKFGQATALVSVGTALFFFSVSGFLLRFLQGRPGVYLRGLNAFTLRQLNSRVNTAWVSITLVCAMLFVAICGVCTGFSVSRGISDALEKGSPYDASINAYPRGLMIAGMDDADYDLPEVNEEAASDGFDMVAAMRRKVSDWDDIVSATAQVNQYMPSGAQGGSPSGGPTRPRATPPTPRLTRSWGRMTPALPSSGSPSTTPCAPFSARSPWSWDGTSAWSGVTLRRSTAFGRRSSTSTPASRRWGPRFTRGAWPTRRSATPPPHR